MSWFDAYRIEATNDWVITSNVFFSANLRILATVEVVEYDGERIPTDKGVLEIDGGVDVDIQINSIEYALGDTEDFQPFPFEIHPNDMEYLEAMIEKEAHVFLR